ncbi:MAG: signal peptidase I [Nitrospiraceae bacterium]
MIALSPDRLIETYSQVSSINKRSLDKLTTVLTRFRAGGIDCILLKGADILSRLYGVRGMRPMVDVDLLVREHDLAAIDEIVTALGFLPEIDGNPAYRDPENALALDLITEVWYSDDLEGIWQRAVQRTLEGLPVKGMGAEDLLIFLTAYTVLHRGCFSPSYPKDLALLVRKEPLDWEFIVDEAFRRHLKVALYHGLSYAVRREAIPIPDHVFTRLAPSGPTEKTLAWLLQKLVTDRFEDGISHFLLFITQPGAKKWWWLQKAFCPPRAFLQYRYGERGATHPTWTRLKRACSLAVRAQLLLVQVLFLLFKRVRSRGETTIQTLDPGHLNVPFSLADLVSIEDFSAVHHLFTFKVVSWSMFPTILKGDVIEIEPADQIQIGDVVVFRQMGVLVCHRVTGLGAAGDLCTNGDQAEGPGTPIPHRDVLGKVTTITRGGKQVQLDSLPNPSAVSFIRMKVDLSVTEIRQRLLSLALRGVELLKQIPWVRDSVAFALNKLVRVSVGVRAPVRSIHAYRFVPLHRLTLQDCYAAPPLSAYHTTDALILVAHLGRYPLGTFDPGSGEVRIRRVAAGLGLEESLRNLNQQMQSAQPSGRS